MDALAARSAREAASEIEDLETDAYNPFNLLVADAEIAHVVSYAGSPERIDLVRKATTVVEGHLKDTKAFQYMAILHEDRVTGMRDGKRDFGLQIEVRCWDSVDARTASATRLPFETLEKIAEDIISGVPGVVSVTYNIATKPPSTIEVV